MGAALSLVAIAGGLALLSRLVRTVLRLALHAAEATAASGLAEVSARRGDLTAMAERREQEERARRHRRAEFGRLLLWAVWLAAPPIFGWMPEAYAAAAILWLIPSGPLLRPRPLRSP